MDLDELSEPVRAGRKLRTLDSALNERFEATLDAQMADRRAAPQRRGQGHAHLHGRGGDRQQVVMVVPHEQAARVYRGFQ